MRENGVARTVIVQVIHKWDNRYLAGVLKRYPGLFAGVCRVATRRMLRLRMP